MAKISAVRIAPAHEGVAELIVTIAYPNGGKTDYPLDELAAQYLFKIAEVDTPEALVNLDWKFVREAITHSYNRHQP